MIVTRTWPTVIVLVLLLAGAADSALADGVLPPPQIRRTHAPAPPSTPPAVAVPPPAPIVEPMYPGAGLASATLVAPLEVGRLVRRRRGSYRIDLDTYRPRGPTEVRDEWLISQPRLTLPAVSPDPVPVNQWIVGAYVNRGSDFGWNQRGPAEMPFLRRFMVDGEHQTTAVSARYGLRPRLSLGVRVPVHWRGGGFMDAIIDEVHEWFEPIGARDNGRPAFDRDRYRVEGRDEMGRPISWNDERSTGLGNVELSAHWNVVKPRHRRDWRAAVVARMTLPTGTGPFDVGGVDGGLQLAVAKQVGHRLDVYAGVGGTVFGEDELDGIEYERWRVQGFLAFEYHLTRSASIVLSTDAASRLVTNLDEYPATQWYMHLSVRWDMTRRLEIEIGFTENLEHQQATIDFGGFLGVNVRL